MYLNFKIATIFLTAIVLNVLHGRLFHRKFRGRKNAIYSVNAFCNQIDAKTNLHLRSTLDNNADMFLLLSLWLLVSLDMTDLQRSSLSGLDRGNR